MDRVEAAAVVKPLAAAPMLTVEVLYCARPGHTDSVAVQLPAGSTAAEAVAASGVLQRHALQPEGLTIGIWCRVQAL